MSPPTINPLEAVNLGDLSKIDISAEVTKLLTSMKQSRNNSLQTVSTPEKSSSASAEASNSMQNTSSDPRAARQVRFYFFLFLTRNIVSSG